EEAVEGDGAGAAEPLVDEDQDIGIIGPDLEGARALASELILDALVERLDLRIELGGVYRAIGERADRVGHKTERLLALADALRAGRGEERRFELQRAQGGLLGERRRGAGVERERLLLRGDRLVVVAVDEVLVAAIDELLGLGGLAGAELTAGARDALVDDRA